MRFKASGFGFYCHSAIGEGSLKVRVSLRRLQRYSVQTRLQVVTEGSELEHGGVEYSPTPDQSLCEET